MNRIKVIRGALGIKQGELAALACVSQPYLHDLENNRRGAKPETWNKIADALGVTVEQLKGDDHEQADDDPAGG